MLSLLLALFSITVTAQPVELKGRRAESMIAQLEDVTGTLGIVQPACQVPFASDNCGATPNNNMQGSHGQILIGNDRNGPLYMNHLPLRTPPHNFQAIYEVDFADAAVKDAYFDALASSGERFGSLGPQNRWNYPTFNCQVISGTRRELQGRPFTGHLEQGGESLGSEARLVIKRRIYFKEFPDDFPEVGGEPNPRSDADYIVFGQGSQFFAARVVNRFPEAEHIMPVPAAPFRALGDRNHGCFRVTQQAGQMRFEPRDCAEPSLGQASDFSVQTIPYDNHYVNLNDLQ